MTDLIKLLAALILAFCAGWAALSAVFYKEKALSMAERVSLSCPVGFGLISIGMAALSFFGVAFSPTSILAGLLPIFFLALMAHFKRKDHRQAAPVTAFSKAPLGLLEKFLILGISFGIVYAFFLTLIKPIEAYDAIAIYGLKSKIFYFSKAIPSNFFVNFRDFVPHTEYPLLIPLAETYIYIMLGSLNDLLVKVVFPIYYLGILAISYLIMRKLCSRKKSLLLLFFLSTIPIMRDHTATGYADIPFTFYYSASFFYLFLWMRRKNTSYLTLSFILSALGLWAKQEGLLLWLVNIAVSVAYILIDNRRRFKELLPYGLFSLALISGYIYTKSSMGLELSSDFTGLGKFGLTNLTTAFKRVPLILYEYQIQFFGPKKWNLVWILFVAGFISNIKTAFSKELLPVTLAIMFIFSAYGVIYMVTPQAISWHLSTSASRLFIHFVPLIVLWLAILSEKLSLDI